MTTQRQKISIPDDWNGVDWTCVQIQWPDSPLWLAILRGFIITPSRGRFWDQDTGIVTEVQQIGFLIEKLNYLLTECNGAPLPPPDPDVIEYFCGGGGDDEDDMGQCMTDLTFEDGVWYKWFGPCCKIAITGDGQTIAQPPPEDTTEDPEEPQTWACNKASYMAFTLTNAIGFSVDAMSPHDNQWDMYDPLNDVLVKYGANWDQMLEVVGFYIADRDAIDIVVADEDTQQWITCAWVSMVSETDNLSMVEWETMLAGLGFHFSVAVADFFQSVFRAIGYTQMAWSAKLGHDNPATCLCPDDPDPYVGDLHFTGDTFDALHPEYITSMYAENNGKRLFMEWTAPEGTFIGDTDLKIGILMDKALASFKIEVSPVLGYDVPKREWDTDCGKNPTNWTLIELGVEWDEDTSSPSPGVQLTEVEHGSGTGTRTNFDYKARKCPSGEAPEKVYQFWFEITSVDGTPV
jgi:hypothetical protein